MNIKHGTATSYWRQGCRCEKCRVAATAYTREWRKRNKEKALDPDDPRHGSPNLYANYGCRCEACRQAKTDAGNKRKADKAWREVFGTPR